MQWGCSDNMFQSAPHFSSEANSTTATGSSSNSEFQSAPHFSSEANSNADDAFVKIGGFNPRLTSAARRTLYRGRLLWPSHEVSIRASLQQRGEPISPLGTDTGCRVSIRASLQQRGEPQRRRRKFLPSSFQSAPHFSSEANTPKRYPRGDRHKFQSAPHFSSEANLDLHEESG